MTSEEITAIVRRLTYNEQGLIPTVVQEERTDKVLMVAYMNEESLRRTLTDGETWFYSRSRQELWHKGGTSGHTQQVVSIATDCDADTLLIEVEQTGAACHEGTLSCFSRKLGENEIEGELIADTSKIYGQSLSGVLHELYHIINDRKLNPKEGSYTTYLFEKGQDKILKKVGEEAAETIIASKNNDKNELISEMSDLWYHCLVLLSNHEVTPSELMAELQKRRK